MNIFNKHTRPAVWINLILMSSLYTEIKCTRELRLLGLLSETGVSYKSSGSCLTAIDMALEDISHRDDILKNYNLTFNWVDSKCHAGTALFRMFESLKDDRPYHMVLGPPCSIAAEATAQVSFMWNLTQLSCEATSPVLSDRTRFPRFFRTVMPDQKLNIAILAILNEFKWKKVATVHQAREFFFSEIIGDFVQRIQNTNISIITQEIVANDPFSKAKDLKKNDARIIMVSMYEDKARELICAAYKAGLYGPKIVWMFHSWYSATFWQNDLGTIECTKEQMGMVVEGSFLTGGLLKNPVEEKGIANITVTEFEYRYFNHPKYSPKWKDSDENSAALCYDYIWTAALALECTVQALKENGHHKTLDQFTYADGDIGKIIFDCMGNTSMIGVSGKTSFEEGSDTEKAALIERIQDSRRIKIGLYRQDKDPSFFEWIEGAIKWKDDMIPTDSVRIKNEEIQIPLSLYSVMISLGALGICLSFSFLGINIIYRNNRYVKLSSPNINNILLVGCILCYMTVFFKTTGSENAAICRVKVYCFSLGFTIMFGSLFSKTWRVYRIFLNKKLSRVVTVVALFRYLVANFPRYSTVAKQKESESQISDGQLYIVNCLLVALILVQLIVWDIFSPPVIKSKFLPKKVYVTNDDTKIRPFVRECSSEYSTYFNWALYITQGALLTFGTFLAWETRHVHIKGLNDSQKIGISIYNVVILSIVGVMLTLLLEDQQVLLYGISSGFLIFGTTVTQMLIFIPKVRAIINKVEIESVSTFASNTQMSKRYESTAEPFKGAGSIRQPSEKQEA